VSSIFIFNFCVFPYLLLFTFVQLLIFYDSGIVMILARFFGWYMFFAVMNVKNILKLQRR